jgi:hypothetical protein
MIYLRITAGLSLEYDLFNWITAGLLLEYDLLKDNSRPFTGICLRMSK